MQAETGQRNLAQAAQSRLLASPRARRMFKGERVFPVLTLVPSLILLGVFVYGFIAWTGYVSTSNWNSLIPDFSFSGIRNFLLIFQDFRFESDLRNVLVFTVLFLFGCLSLGLLLAVLIDQRIRFEAFFRSVFIFPMAISFIVTGVVWQWLLNPQTGINLILEALGVSHPPQWFVDTTIWPNIPLGQISFGVPVALFSVAIAAVWQMSGFAMALYLAGLRAIPEEVREAVRVDGAGAWRGFWLVIFPQLRPITLSVVIVLTAASLKIFDLIYAMTGPGSLFVTDMPSMDMFNTTFQGNHYAQGAAIAIVLLILVALFIVPYLATALRQGGERA